MDKLKSLVKDNNYFLLPCVVLWIVGMVFLALYDKISIQLWFNEFYADWQNYPWLFVTFMGDTTFFIICVIFSFFFSRRCALYLVVMGLSIMIVSYVLKQIFDEPRPLTVFTELGIFDMVKTVPGYELRSWNSFPSGHTISAFGLFCMMAFFLKKHYLKLLVMVVAVLVAYSRVYLMQHFYVDVYVGSMIGVAMAIVTYCILDDAKWVKKLLKEK